MTHNERAAELHTLFDDLLSRGQRPTWITGRNDAHGEACVRLTWDDVALLRARCRPWYRRALTAIDNWFRS